MNGRAREGTVRKGKGSRGNAVSRRWEGIRRDEEGKVSRSFIPCQVRRVRGRAVGMRVAGRGAAVTHDRAVNC